MAMVVDPYTSVELRSVPYIPATKSSYAAQTQAKETPLSFVDDSDAFRELGSH